MNQKNPQAFSLRDAGGQFSAPLLDRLMDKGRENLKHQGVDVEHMGQTKAEQRPLWAELEAMYNNIAEGLVENVVYVKSVFDALKQFNLPGYEELALTIRAFTSDADSISKNLVEVHNRHKDFTGEVKDGDEMTIHANCGNDYTGISIKWQGLTHPTMLALTEFHAQAKFALKDQIAREEAEAAKTPLTPEQDPTVITDVEVKEQ